MHISDLPLFMHVQHVCVWCPGKPENVVIFPGTGVTGRVIDGRDLPCGYWQLSLGPLEEKPGSSVSLTMDPFL